MVVNFDSPSISSKIFLIGTTSQATNLQTYSHDTVYVGTDGCLCSNNIKVSVEGHGTHVPSYTTSNNGQFLRVVNGAVAWQTVSSAESASF